MATPVPPDEPDGERAGSCGLPRLSAERADAPPDANSDRLTFAEDDRAGVAELLHDERIIGRERAFEQHRAAGRRQIEGVEVVLEDDRNAVERRARPLAFALRVERTCGVQRLRIQRQNRSKVGPLPIVGLDPRDRELHEPLRGEGAGPERRIQVGDGGGIEIEGLSGCDRRPGGEDRRQDEREGTNANHCGLLRSAKRSGGLVIW